MRSRPALPELLSGLAGGDRVMLGRALSLVESRLEADQALAQTLLESLTPGLPGQRFTVGITGPPGAGKSTLIEALGMHYAEGGESVAVIAVDPSSATSGGAILGDKTRMEQLSRHPRAFVRPAPAAGHLGGTSPATREAVALCQAAGYERVIVETVGVGQSETEVAAVADVAVLVLPPASGDDLQGVKRGIVEVADVIVINKADGALAPAAAEAARQYAQAQHLFPPRPDGWQVPVLTASALTGLGIAELVQALAAYAILAGTTGTLEQRRAQQRQAWFEALLWQTARRRMEQDAALQARLAQARVALEQGAWPAGLVAGLWG